MEIKVFLLELLGVTSNDANYNSLGGNDVADVSIVNDDTDSAFISINNVSVSESAGTADLTVTLLGNVENAFTVDFNTSNDTATSGNDFVSIVAGQLDFTGNSTETETITITILPDQLIEADETFDVILSNISNPDVRFSVSIGTVTILNDDNCRTGTDAPIQNNRATNFCDIINENLNDFVGGVAPTGAELRWSLQDNNLVDDANHLASSVISAAGTYYGFYYDDLNGCVSDTVEIELVLNTTPFPGNPQNTSVFNDNSVGNTH